jgi:hypothetical protein
MTRLHTVAIALSASFAAAPASGQSARWPSAEVLAGADRFDPPLARELAAKLAQQPDMTGLWTQLVPKGVGAGPVFDPEHTHYSPQIRAVRRGREGGQGSRYVRRMRSLWRSAYVGRATLGLKVEGLRP